MKNYSTYWSENVIFWGAGATQALGIRMTAGLSEDIFISADLKGNISIDSRVNNVFRHCDEAKKQGIKDLLFLLSHMESLAYEANAGN